MYATSTTSIASPSTSRPTASSSELISAAAWHPEQIVLNDGREAAMWLTMSNKSYDFAYSLDHSGTPGRFHHVTYAVDSREEFLLAADIFLENGIQIETPAAQACDPADVLPVCLRARRQPRRGRQCRRAPDPGAGLEARSWWTEAERKKGQAWGLKTIESLHTHGTPPVDLKKHARSVRGSSRRAQSSRAHRSMPACPVRTAGADS